MVNSHCKLHKKQIFCERGASLTNVIISHLFFHYQCVLRCAQIVASNWLKFIIYFGCQLFCGKLWYFRCVSIFITNAFYGKTHRCHLSLYPWVLPWNYGKGHYMAKPIHHDFCHGIWLLPYVYDFSHGIPYYGLDSRCPPSTQNVPKTWIFQTFQGSRFKW